MRNGSPNFIDTISRGAERLGLWPFLDEVAQLTGFNGNTADMNERYMADRRTVPPADGNWPEAPYGGAPMGLPDVTGGNTKERRREEMNKTGDRFDKIIHNSRLRALSRRGVAMALALVMTAGMLPGGALAAAGGAWPIQAAVNVADPAVDPAAPDGTGEAPTVTIEVNGVIDQGRQLTGFVEVAIRVKPGVLHLAADGTIVNSTLDPNYDHSETQPFSSLAVALEYSDKLTPWEWEKVDGDWNRLDETEPGNQSGAIDATTAIGGGFSARKMMEIDPLHKSTRIAHAAISPKGTVTGGGAVTTADGDGGTTTPTTPPTTPPTATATGGGYLYLMAEGFTAKDFNNEDTVLAVVRFKYDLDQGDDNKNPWGTMFSKGLNNPDVTDWIDPSSPSCLVKLTDAATLKTPIDPIEDWEVIYNSGKSATRPQGNRFYYSTDTTEGMEAYDPTKPTNDPDYASMTSNCMEVALVDTSAATPSTTAVVPGKVNYTLVNKLSYNFSSGDSAVILYYDWDDRHIGTQVLSPGDAREAVNQYVEETFIHPDLRYSAHKTDPNASDYTDSLLRENTYRGEYPYDAPVAIPDVTSPTYETDLAAYQAAIAATVAEDGAGYPLTNKLDYVFFKRYTQMGQTVTDPDGVPDSGDETSAPARTLIDPDNTPDSGDEYYHIDSYDTRLLGGLTSADVEEPGLLELPYIYGWAVVEDLEGITDVWTTLGTAEHTPYTGMDGNQLPVDTTVDTTYGATGDCMQFADFSNLQKGQVVRVKAVYEPGTNLKANEAYTTITKPEYERYGNSATPDGGVYAISFSYGRVEANGYGVSRMRDPSFRIDYAPDVEGENQKPFSTYVDLENRDVLNVTYTPSSALTDMQYSLRDKKLYVVGRVAEPIMVDYNFYTGSDRSYHSNRNNLMDNFNYEEHPYSQHLGSMGFVTQATLNQLAKLCREAAATGVMADINAYVDLNMIKDLNLKAGIGQDGTPIEYVGAQATQFRAKLIDAYRIAGNEDLDWHQLQYHLINTTYSGGVVSGGLTNTGSGVSPAPSALAYNWCRIDDCSGGSSPINTWTDLMKAAADYVYTPNTNAFNQLQDVFKLRQGITATPFADKDAMKTQLIAVVTDLKTNGFTQTGVESLSWKQVQYLMDLKNDGTGLGGITPATLPADADITPTGATKKDYWWENGGKKTITTWQELLEIQYHILNDSWFAGDANTSGWRTEYDDPTDTLTGAVRDKDAAGAWKPTTDPNPFTTKAVALRKDAAGGAFASILAFDTALNGAIGILTGEAAYATGSFAGISLMEIQHALLGQAYKTESDLMDDTVAGNINYWWITGASTPKNLKELVTLVEQVLDGAPDDMLDNVSVELVSKAPFWLRSDSAGAVFGSDAALHAALKTAVGTWRAQGGNSSATAPWPDTTNTNWSDPATRQVWSQLQNLLLGNSYNGDPDPSSPYAFWWYGDGHRPITNLEELLEAAWNSWGDNGNPPSDSSDPNAMDALDETADNLKFITGVLNTDPNFKLDDLDFRKNDDGDAFTTVGDFKTAFKSFIQAAAGYGGKAFVLGHKDHWTVIQWYLINNTYRFDFDVENDSSINYWWKDGGAKPTGPSANYTWADSVIQTLTRAASNGGSGGASVSDIEALLTDATVRALNIKTSSTGTPMNKQQLAQKIVDTVDDYFNNYHWSGTDWENNLYDWGTDELPLDWRSFQNYVVSGNLEDLSNTSQAVMDSSYGIDWFPGDDESAGADYTAANAYVAYLTTLASATQGGASVGDLGTITEDDAKGLNIRAPGGTSACSAAQLEQYIVDTVNDYYNSYHWSGTDWENNLYDWGNDVLPLDWKSLQNYIITGNTDDLSGATYEDMKTNYGIDWYPVNDVVAPGSYAIPHPSLKAPARKPVEESETTNVTESPDGSRKVTTKVKTTVDPNTGLTTVEEERTEERRYPDGRVETVTDVTIVITDTATGREVDRNTQLGTPVVTDGAEVVAPIEPEKPAESEKPEETEPPVETEPSETEPPEETEPPAETEPSEPEPSEGTEPPAETEKPEETEPPVETEPSEPEPPEETEPPTEPEEQGEEDVETGVPAAPTDMPTDTGTALNTEDPGGGGDPPLQGRLRASLARRLYAGPPGLIKRPPLRGLVSIRSYITTTTGRTRI